MTDEATVIALHRDACGCELPFVAEPLWRTGFAHVAELGRDVRTDERVYNR